MSRLTALLALALTACPLSAAAPARGDAQFDGAAAWAFLVRQVELGPRPAGSPASRQLGAVLRASVPAGRFQSVPGGLRNVVGVVPGRRPGRVVVIGAHYDTKDLDGFVGANDNASGVAVVRQLARTIRPRTLRPTVVFVFFDGEETPRDAPDPSILRSGLRGSKVAARSLRGAQAMILVDLVGDRSLAIRRDARADAELWRRLLAASTAAGTRRHFTSRRTEILDDHVPFAQAGVRTLPLVDLDFRCWHEQCDDLSAVSRASLTAVGRTLLELLGRL
ncbi:MAG TPA: M28 family metallopeptidase [Gaiellaceae bacterium]|nr:M28 family metallopeptidase [Gaiellaceae bacterium]